jgi:hypothetical protein
LEQPRIKIFKGTLEIPAGFLEARLREPIIEIAMPLITAGLRRGEFVRFSSAWFTITVCP